MSSAYRQLESAAFSLDSTWINLGLWERERMTFREANEALAARLLERLGDLRQVTTLLDIGCGNGDSLEYWARHVPPTSTGKRPKIVGVNSNAAEYLHCCYKFQNQSGGDEQVQLVLSDAVEYMETAQEQGEAAVVCLDAIYHFAPSRFAFFHALTRRANVKHLSCSDIVLSEKWSREWGKLDFVTDAGRRAFLVLISYASGTPLCNLRNSARDVHEELRGLGWTLTSEENVTNLVFLPFSEYCMRERQSSSWFSKRHWTLLSSALFMRLLQWSGAVEFVIYSAERN